MRWRIPRYYPGWFVSGGGGSGGSGTVQTDGVTINGDGSAGNKIAILAVQLAARLTGAGTVASPIDVAGWPVTAFLQYSRAADQEGSVANKLIMSGVHIPIPVTFSKLIFQVLTGDGANNSDFGLYNAAGTLIANIGARHISATGTLSIATVQGSQTITPGVYFVAYTSASNVLNILGSYNNLTLYSNTNGFGTSSGGALPASITPPALSPANNCVGFGLM